MSNTRNPEPMPDVLFKLSAVGVQFGLVHALVNCTLSIGHGERVALVGANGSGKSTLLRHLHGLLPASSGQMLQPVPARQAMLFQRPYMLRTSVQNNVAIGLWLGGMRWSAARQQALVALERVGLAALAERSGKTLSGGQQQRLALARAWALKPQVLLLDEPTASLDPAAKREVDDLTRQKDAVTSQLGQMLSGLSGLVPGVGAAAKAAGVETAKPAATEASAPRGPEAEKNGAVAAKNNS